jgi:CRP-like cAMP-binding protein
MEQLKKTLAQMPFLKDLTAPHLKTLAEHARRVRFESGQVIGREGDPADRFYLLLNGRVAIEAFIAEEGNVGFQNVGPGEPLGWSWLFPPFRWHFTARALESTEAVEWDTELLRQHSETDPKFGYEIASRLTRVLLGRLRATTKTMMDFYAPKA